MACNAGNPGSIPGSGRSPGEGNGSPLQYSYLENSMTEEPRWLQSIGLQRVGPDWATNAFIFSLYGLLVEKAMAPHSSTLAWKIPWTEEPGRLQSMGSRRVGHDWVTSLSLFSFMHWRSKWQPTPVFLPGESQGQEPGELPSMGSHRVRHDWSDLA